MEYKFTNLSQDNRGIALMMALLILTSILVVSLGAADLVMSGLKMSGTQERSTIAYFAAEAGIEQVLWEIRKNGFDISACAVDDYVDFNVSPAVCDSLQHVETLSNNSSYSVVLLQTLPSRIFVSTGEYAGVRRVVEISY